MTYEHVGVEHREGLALLTLRRPETSNAVHLELARDLHEATLDLASTPGVRAVLLRGEGKTFCAGGDLKSFVGRDDLPRYLRDITTYLHAALARLAELEAPVVAAVQGAAAGAGFSLACSCDLVLAARSARFVMAYTRIGMSPDGSGSWYLPRLVGLQRALDLALTNRMLSADEAAEWGIVSRVVEDDALEVESLALATQLAEGPTGALGRAKRLLRTSFDNALERQMEVEAQLLATSAASEDGREGIDAFLAKRTPRYTGR